MTVPFLTNLDLNKNELQNAKIQNLATDPAGGTKGVTYFNTTTNKLMIHNGTAFTTADAYTHPATHPATMITEDSTHRFVTDTDKNNWNAKETTAGAQAKADQAETDAINWAKGYGLGTALAEIVGDFNTQQTTGFYYMKDSLNAPTAHRFYMLVVIQFGTSYTVQLAYAYGVGTTDVTPHIRQQSVGNVWSTWKKALTENDITSIQSGSNSYTDQKIADLIASSPATLDTLNELATALGNDPNFATTMTTSLGNKVDKITGKGLSTNDYTTAEKDKLAGIATNANNYVHPATHPPSIIAQDTSNRFVSDTEKATWNGKAGKYSASMGNASATSFVITHNLNTQDVVVALRETASPYSIVYADVEATSVNTITVKFATAPTTNQYRVTIMG